MKLNVNLTRFLSTVNIYLHNFDSVNINMSNPSEIVRQNGSSENKVFWVDIQSDIIVGCETIRIRPYIHFLVKNKIHGADAFQTFDDFINSGDRFVAQNRYQKACLNAFFDGALNSVSDFSSANMFHLKSNFGKSNSLSICNWLAIDYFCNFHKNLYSSIMNSFVKNLWSTSTSSMSTAWRSYHVFPIAK